MKYFLIALGIFGISFQEIEGFCFKHTLGPHTIFLGPEVCHLSRHREGGSKQSGWLYGGHLRYDRIAKDSVYWAFDAYCDTGNITGKTASGRKIKSTITEYEIQARLGYSIYWGDLRELLIIPYGTYSYFHGKNKFEHPSPAIYTLHDTLHLGGGGVWISFALMENCRCGLDFSAKYMIQGKNHVRDDPEFDNVSLEIESKWQYEIDLPIEFIVPLCDYNFEVRFVPFYRFRHLGGKPNYPFDFYETKFETYGAQFLVSLGF